MVNFTHAKFSIQSLLIFLFVKHSPIPHYSRCLPISTSPSICGFKWEGGGGKTFFLGGVGCWKFWSMQKKISPMIIVADFFPSRKAVCDMKLIEHENFS